MVLAAANGRSKPFVSLSTGSASKPSRRGAEKRQAGFPAKQFPFLHFLCTSASLRE